MASRENPWNCAGTAFDLPGNCRVGRSKCSHPGDRRGGERDELLEAQELALGRAELLVGQTSGRVELR
jgi:hypothetical protein